MNVEYRKCLGCKVDIFFHESKWLNLETTIPHNENECIKTYERLKPNWFEKTRSDLVIIDICNPEDERIQDRLDRLRIRYY